MFRTQLDSHFVRMPSRLAISLIFAPFLFAPQSVAQQANNSTVQQSSGSIEDKRNEFGIWGGLSFHSPTLIGKTPDARFGNIGLRYGRILAANDSLAFSWTIDAVPVAVLSVNRFTIVPTGTGSFTIQREREHTYGAGVSPIGLKLNFRPAQKYQPFASGSAGFLYFTKDVPVPGAARFNFTYDFGGGLQIVKESGRAITLGYKYNHISNGYHSPINPGVDVQMIYVGYSIRR
jgi:hypothetical protein